MNLCDAKATLLIVMEIIRIFRKTESSGNERSIKWISRM